MANSAAQPPAATPLARGIIVACALVALLAAAPAPAPIAVHVTGVESATGLVHVDICPQEEFLKTDCRWWAEAPAVAGTTTVIVAGVPPGRYAAQGFHDANGNHKPDRNLFGIPTERVGFSNDAPIHLGPPRWRDAVFEHGPAAQTITFKVRKFP